MWVKECGELYDWPNKQIEPKTEQAEYNQGWFYKLALLDFELIFEVKMQESEGV